MRFTLATAAALLAVALAAAALPAPAAAAERRSVFVEDLTWTELRDRVAAGATTIIVPIGGTEQSGPHIALGKHNARAIALSAKIAAQLGNALVAPVIAYVPEGSIDPPSGHMRFPGTISIPPEVFEQTLEAAGRSFKRSGFRDVVFLGDHGGYQALERRAAERLNREWAGSTVRAHAVEEYYRAADSSFTKALEERGFPATEIGTHAGLADTSLTMALAPSLVRTEALGGNVKFGPSDGVYGGDPRRANAELGAVGVDLIVAETVAAIRRDVARR